MAGSQTFINYYYYLLPPIRLAGWFCLAGSTFHHPANLGLPANPLDGMEILDIEGFRAI